MIDDAIEILCIVHFEQRGHAKFDAENLKVDDLTLSQALCDEQDGIGTGRARLPDLIGVDDEVFAKYRQGDRISNRMNELELSAKIVSVGEARDRRRSRRVIVSSDGDWVELFANHSSGWALVLDLRNEACACCAAVVNDCLEKVAGAAEF